MRPLHIRQDNDHRRIFQLHFPHIRIGMSKRPARQVPQGFSFICENTYSCGELINTVRKYRHDTTRMEFVLIPGGMTVHKVPLSPYLIGRYQCTQGQWQKVMGNNPSSQKGENYPVETVSWGDCMEFCKKTELELPTEAQWEYACRAGNVKEYCFGDDVSRLKDYAWYDENSGVDDGPHPVGQKNHNAFGLYDMHGNVWEWCADKSEEQVDYLVDPAGPKSGSRRVYRGGSCYCIAEACRSSESAFGSAGHRYANMGVRLIKLLR